MFWRKTAWMTFSLYRYVVHSLWICLQTRQMEWLTNAFVSTVCQSGLTKIALGYFSKCAYTLSRISRESLRKRDRLGVLGMIFRDPLFISSIIARKLWVGSAAVCLLGLFMILFPLVPVVAGIGASTEAPQVVLLEE